MKIVYRAAHSTDAHLIRQLLEQEGMLAFVNGGLLEGGAGELPMGGLATVSVADEHEARALEVVREWESMPVPDDEDEDEDEAAPAASPHLPPPLPPAPRGRGWAPVLIAALLGTGVGAFVTWLVLVQAFDTDLSGDEVRDERMIYEADRLARIEVDRNRDRQFDEILHFDKDSGRQIKAELDDDFDGFFESVATFERGNWRSTTSDNDANGEVDYRADAEHGVIESEEWRDVQHRVVKRLRYEKGRTVSGEFDSDGDGKLDTARRYDALGEIVSATPIAP